MDPGKGRYLFSAAGYHFECSTLGCGAAGRIKGRGRIFLVSSIDASLGSGGCEKLNLVNILIIATSPTTLIDRRENLNQMGEL